jgi:hypothetical protein
LRFTAKWIVFEQLIDSALVYSACCLRPDLFVMSVAQKSIMRTSGEERLWLDTSFQDNAGFAVLLQDIPDENYPNVSEITAVENKLRYNQEAAIDRNNVVSDWESVMNKQSGQKHREITLDPTTTVGFLGDECQMKMKINDLDREVRRDVRFNQMCAEYHEKGWSRADDKEAFFKEGERGHALASGYDFTENFMEKFSQLTARKQAYKDALKMAQNADSPWEKEEAERIVAKCLKYRDSVSLNTISVRNFPGNTLKGLMDLYEQMRIPLMGFRKDAEEFIPGKTWSQKDTVESVVEVVPEEKKGGLARTTSHVKIYGVKCYLSQKKEIDLIVNPPTSPRDEIF